MAKKVRSKKVKERKFKKVRKIGHVKIRRLNKKRITLFFIIIALIIIVVLTFTFKDKLLDQWNIIIGNKFEWHNMTWYKNQAGSITIYSTKLVILRESKNDTLYYILNLRNNPKKLESIPVEINDTLQKMVYVSFEAEPLKCNYTILAAWRLGEFIDAMGLEKEGAFASPDLLENITVKNEENESYKVKNCSDAKEGTSVILFKESETNKSRIYQDNYCYILEAANCETLEVAERFVLAIIELRRK